MTIIPTLIKLFAINIVANSLLGFSNKIRIFLSLSLSISSSSSRLCEVREKRDTSEPETKADNRIKKIRNRNPEAKPIVISLTSKVYGAKPSMAAPKPGSVTHRATLQ